MQVSSHTDTPISSGGQLITPVGINGSHASNQVAYANAPKQLILENVDPTSLEEEDSDSDGADGAFVSQVHQQMQLTPGLQNMAPVLAGPKPGKKTKGRVKIKMEFIENKLRRYTTFSKRKTGIMKKVHFTYSFMRRIENDNTMLYVIHVSIRVDNVFIHVMHTRGGCISILTADCTLTVIPCKHVLSCFHSSSTKLSLLRHCLSKE